MSIWVGISPLIGVGSLAGFAVGATVSGALFLAIAVPWRVRRRQAAAAGAGGLPASASSPEAGAFDAGLYGAGALEAAAERVVQLQPGDQNDVGSTSPTGQAGPDGGDGQDSQDSQPAAYRSRHRLGDPIPDRVARDRASAGRTRRSSAFPRSAFPGWTSRDHAQPDTSAGDVASCDVTFPDGAFRPARRPEVRRLPRHAAPTVSFRSKVSGRVTGLFAARPLAGGAPG
jgi:hypothetical protein